MFTGGTIWVLTHGQMVSRNTPPERLREGLRGPQPLGHMGVGLQRGVPKAGAVQHQQPVVPEEGHELHEVPGDPYEGEVQTLLWMDEIHFAPL